MAESSHYSVRLLIRFILKLRMSGSPVSVSERMFLLSPLSVRDDSKASGRLLYGRCGRDFASKPEVSIGGDDFYFYRDCRLRRLRNTTDYSQTSQRLQFFDGVVYQPGFYIGSNYHPLRSGLSG